MPAGHHQRIAEKLEAVERGEIDRLMIFMPPRHGKSELASKRFPAWCLGRNPRRQIIAASYNSDLASDFGRNVRNIVAAPEFGQVFSDVSLAPDSQAANRMNTNKGGTYVAAGVGTAVTGRGADIALIDDPFKDREEADSERRRETVWDWYRSTLYTRLMPGGAIVLIQCMVGDTPVLMADGTQRELRRVGVGEMVASYEDGALVGCKVLNHASQGVDSTFAIRTKSGNAVTANARHPFLVDRHGVLEWIRLRNLQVGDKLVRVTGESGAALPAPSLNVLSQHVVRASAPRTTTSNAGQTAPVPHPSTQSRGEKRISNIATESVGLNTTLYSPSRAAFAQSATSHPAQTSVPTGAVNSALTIAMEAARSADFFATTAISQSATASQSASYSPLPHTYEITVDEIITIEPAGEQEVFDIEVEGAANFIAGGLVSHNTRWHEDDLAGRLLEQEGGQWDVLELPAIDTEGQALWPEWYDVPALARIRDTIGPREWSALYQQQPQPDEGTYFQREWFAEWQTLPPCNFYGTSDYAVTDGGGDYTVHRVWGVDKDGVIYRVAGWRGQTTSDVWIDEKLNLVEKWKPLAWFGEAGVIQKAIEPMLKRRMMERKVFCRLEWMSSISDKPTRARGFQSRAAMGLVRFELGADITEHLMFPAGKHDDDVDNSSLIGRALDEMHPAIVKSPVVDPNPRMGDYRQRRPASTASAWG